jgi:hypothetical protein
MNYNARQEILINAILSEMDFSTKRGDILTIIQDQYGTADRTFDKYYKVAKERFAGTQNLVQEARQAQTMKKIALAKEKQLIEMELDGSRDRIMNKLERMEILTQIARADIKLLKEIPGPLGTTFEINVVPDYNERKAAIAELNKMDGDYAPIKNDLTSKGDKLQSTPATIQVEIITTKEED